MNKKLFGTALLGLLLSAATGTFVSCKDYDDDIENLQNQINGLKSLQTSVDGLKSDLAGVQSTCQANIASAIADLKNGDVKKALADAADAAAKAAAASAEAANATTAATGAQAAADAANTLAEAAKAAAEGISLEEKDAAALAEIAKLAEKVATIEGLKAEIAADVDAKIAAAQLAGSAVDAATLAEIQAALDNLKNAAASIIGKRLTSLVYAPTTYINGIEAINFVNLLYDNWGIDPKNWLGDDPVVYWGYDNHMIADYGVQAKYLVSPAGVTMDGIDSLMFRLNDATNTRATAKDVTISIVEADLADGVLTLDLKKEIAPWTGSLPEVKKLADLLKDLKIIAKSGSQVALKVMDSQKKTIAVIVNGEVWGVSHLSKDNIDTSLETGVNKDANHSFKAQLSALFNGNFTANATATLTEGQIELALKNLELDLNAKEQLVIAALEAKLAESVKDENEKGNDVSVFSDWARVQEENAHPRIHNTAFMQYGLPQCWTFTSKKSSHFWSFHNIYADGTWTDANNNPIDYRTTDTKNKKGVSATYLNDKEHADYYVGYNAVYTDTLDLHKLVTVCINDSYTEIKQKDFAKYGLAFEFHLMDYNVKNENSTKDATNQKDFAKLDEATGVLTPCSENGVEFNADAIGRTPVIQVVLRNTMKTVDPSDDEVIDVRYFKVKWVAEAPSTQLSTVDFATLFGYSCDKYEEGWIYEKDMNLFYTGLNNGKGIGKDQFRKAYPNISDFIYRLPEGVELSAENLDAFVEKYDFDNEIDQIGKATWMYDDEASTQTQNVRLDYYGVWVNPRTDLDWDGNPYKGEQFINWTFAPEQDFTVKGFFYFESADGTQRVYVPTTLNVKKNAIYSQYQTTQWNTETGEVYAVQPKSLDEPNKYRNVNPQLMSSTVYGTKDYSNIDYKTVQIIGSVTYGYTYEEYDATGKKIVGKNPTDIDHLAKMKWAPKSLQAIKQADNKWMDPYALTHITFDESRFDLLDAIVAKKAAEDANWTKNHKNYKWFEYDQYLYYGIPNMENGQVNKEEPLKAGSVAAVIDANNNIYLVDDSKSRDETKGGEVKYDDPSKEGVPTEAARLLVGEKVPVIVYASQCGINYEIHDQYKFNFLRPLLFTAVDNAVELVDVKYKGDEKTINLSSKKDNERVVKLVENYGQLKSEIALWGDDAKKEDNVKLINWYGIRNVHVDNSKVMTNLNVNGTKDDSFDTLLKDIVDEEGNPLYEVIFDNIVKTEVEDPSGEYSDTWKEAYDKNGNAVQPTAAQQADGHWRKAWADAAKTKQKTAPQYDENGKIKYSTIQETEEIEYTSATVKGADNKFVTQKVTLLKWGAEKDGYTFAYNANPYKVAGKDKVDAQPAFKHADGKYYTLPEGSTAGTAVDVTANLIYKEKVEYRQYKDANNATKRAYEYNGKYYADKDGKGIEVIDEANAHKKDDKWYAGKQPAEKEVQVYVFLTKNDPSGAVDANGDPIKVYDLEPVTNEPLTIKAKEPEMKYADPLPVWEQQQKKTIVVETQTEDGVGTVKFHNMSGNAIAKGDSFEVKIPVVIDTKWEEGLTGFIHVVVKSGL